MDQDQDESGYYSQQLFRELAKAFSIHVSKKEKCLKSEVHFASHVSASSGPRCLETVLTANPF